MGARHSTRLPALALFAALIVAAPAAAQQNGGAEPSGAHNGGAVAPSGGSVVTVGDGTFSLAARQEAILGRTVRFRGTVDPAQAGRTVTVERFDGGGNWVPVGATLVRKGGKFLARWKTNKIGRLRFRARLDVQAQAATATPELQITVFRPATATWYGPGFYGRKTACGQTMTRKLIGVAHKWLPCGTEVALYYKGRTMVVPVVDRGPFRRGTDWDLTAATAKSLRFLFTDTVGAVSLRR